MRCKHCIKAGADPDIPGSERRIDDSSSKRAQTKGCVSLLLLP